MGWGGGRARWGKTHGGVSRDVVIALLLAVSRFSTGRGHGGKDGSEEIGGGRGEGGEEGGNSGNKDREISKHKGRNKTKMKRHDRRGSSEPVYL